MSRETANKEVLEKEIYNRNWGNKSSIVFKTCREHLRQVETFGTMKAKQI